MEGLLEETRRLEEQSREKTESETNEVNIDKRKCLEVEPVCSYLHIKFIYTFIAFLAVSNLTTFLLNRRDSESILRRLSEEILSRDEREADLLRFIESNPDNNARTKFLDDESRVV